jgi:putative transcriptional regulator
MKDTFNTEFFRFEYNNMLPSQGRVLISEPFLTDIYFKRSVVLITEHSNEGTIGFVLNKPVNLTVNEAIEDIPDTDVCVSLGGPVNTNSIHYLHKYGKDIPNSVEVLDGIYWGGDFGEIKTIVKKRGIRSSEIRFFLGYSGWSAGQLENELTEDFWIVARINPSLIMKGIDKDIWKTILRDLGGNYKIWADSPSNPSMN